MTLNVCVPKPSRASTCDSVTAGAKCFSTLPSSPAALSPSSSGGAASAPLGEPMKGTLTRAPPAPRTRRRRADGFVVSAGRGLGGRRGCGLGGRRGRGLRRRRARLRPEGQRRARAARVLGEQVVPCALQGFRRRLEVQDLARRRAVVEEEHVDVDADQAGQQDAQAH